MRKEEVIMSWNYAELSKKAKENGGPEKFVKILTNAGKKQMTPLLGVAVVGGVAVGAVSALGIKKVVKYFSQKRAMSDEAVEIAKQELIQGIKEYEADQGNIEEEVEIDEDDINQGEFENE